MARSVITRRERREVVVERRPRQRLQRRALDVRLIHDRVLLLEVEHRRAHLGVVDARPCACADPSAPRRRGASPPRRTRPLGLEAQVLLDVPRRARVAVGERLQRCRRPRRRAPPPGAPRALVLGQLLLLGARAPGPDLIDGEQRSASNAPVQRPRRVDQKAPAQHGQRRAGCRRARGSCVRPPRAAARRRRCDRRPGR